MPIYLDYNATTPPCEASVAAMREASLACWGNPSSVHSRGQAARAMVERARRQVAALVGAQPSKIAFTSGATEANSWVIRGLARPGRLVTSAVEHPSVLGACEAAMRDGTATGWARLPVDCRGRLHLHDLQTALQGGDVGLVSVMWTNNETGNCYPIDEVARMCRRAGVPCHTDATQAVGRIPLSFSEVGVDFASFSAHKMYGPKGVGALYVRAGEAQAFVVGGHQERGRRAGTENAAGIAGFGAAAEAAVDLAEEAARQARLRDRLYDSIVDACSDVVLNGDVESWAPNTLNLSFLECRAEDLIIALDLEGLCVSAGSACSAGSLEPSHVICAMTDDAEIRESAIRLSLGRGTVVADVEAAAAIVAACVRRTRLASKRPVASGLER